MRRGQFPHIDGVVDEPDCQHIEGPVRGGGSVGGITLHARARAADGLCPHCGSPSGRVHGRYLRRLSGAAASGAWVMIGLLVRRYRCLNSACTAVTFVEQVAGLTSPHVRFTLLLREMLTSIAVALAGRRGASPRRL
ncbi:hypothetical protein GCM10027160_54150 [Streptomyces calidiresistens]|uniref:Transposase IS204/IS1001/IS1096/IS1165 zinc-finger domain-containing protein n=1 Tax=Streptomyces calidiresistens TaxID=1485586 RepID=A0A7W3SZA8_9ACTN|nr:transposase family protein [Streptomyces calidiresistens]MBB0228013.1 hypothetical protein [Streptomyces calidiresistens]